MIDIRFMQIDLPAFVPRNRFNVKLAYLGETDEIAAALFLFRDRPFFAPRFAGREKHPRRIFMRHDQNVLAFVFLFAFLQKIPYAGANIAERFSAFRPLFKTGFIGRKILCVFLVVITRQGRPEMDLFKALIEQNFFIGKDRRIDFFCFMRPRYVRRHDNIELHLFLRKLFLELRDRCERLVSGHAA